MTSARMLLASWMAFTEGRALYAENPLIATETDAYADKPLQLYGIIKWQIWQALRLMIDSGLQYKVGWSKEFFCFLLKIVQAYICFPLQYSAIRLENSCNSCNREWITYIFLHSKLNTRFHIQITYVALPLHLIGRFDYFKLRFCDTQFETAAGISEPEHLWKRKLCK